MKDFDYITPIKDKLDEEMHNICILFCTIGTPSESPRWFNFGGKAMDSNKIKIASTQRNIYFWIEVPYDIDYIDVEDFWLQFKQYRTNFLQTHYKTISTF